MTDSEHNIQAAFVDSVLWEYMHDPTFIRTLFFSTLNGAFLGGGNEISRGRVMGKLKKAGALSGVPDIFYLQPRGEYAYLAIELKTESKRRAKDGGLSENQIEFLQSAAMVGGRALVAYGLDEAIEAFRYYMKLEAAYIRELDSVIQSARVRLKSEESRP